MRFNQGFISRSALGRIGAAGLALSLLAGGAVVAQSALTKVPSEVQPGDYKLDPEHGKITWSVDHLGFSTYVGQFVNVQAELKLDPANPSASTLTATIPLTDVASNSDGLNRHLQTADFFDTANHPVATFRSTRIVVDADDQWSWRSSSIRPARRAAATRPASTARRPSSVRTSASISACPPWATR